MSDIIIDNSTVCVLMSVYNGQLYLTDQLESIVRQKDVKLRLYVRDDGSRDNGASIGLVKNFITNHPEIDIHLLEGKNVGFVKSFTILLDEAFKDERNQYFAFADQDDFWKEDKVKVAFDKLLDKERETGCNYPIMYCSNQTLVDANLNILRTRWSGSTVKVSKPLALIQNFATGCTTLFNRRAAELYLRGYNDSVKVHDYFMYLICVYLGHVIYDSESYILYRQHGNNQIGTQSAQQRWAQRLTGNWDKTNFTTKQARMFLEKYGDLLSGEDKSIILKLINYNKNLVNKISMLMDMRYYPEKMESKIIHAIKILKGNF